MNKNRLLEIVGLFSKRKVLVVGDVMLDTTLEVSQKRNPEADTPCYKEENAYYALGGAGNTSANARALGAAVTLCGQVGSDKNGRKIASLCNNLDIQLAPLAKTETIEKIRLVPFDGREKRQLIRLDRGENLKKEMGKSEVKIVLEMTDKKDVVIMADYDKGVFANSLSKTIINYVQTRDQKDTLLTANIKPVNAIQFFGIDFITLNFREASEIMGEKILSLLELWGTVGARMLSVSVDQNGVLIFQGRLEESVTTKPIELADPTGAGDTLTAAMSLALTCDATLKEAAQIGNAAAWVAVQHHGTYAVSQKELIEAIKNW